VRACAAPTLAAPVLRIVVGGAIAMMVTYGIGQLLGVAGV
jgi:VIT1/CCC1 family predicted Fe2+/Mn2+ transporter